MNKSYHILNILAYFLIFLLIIIGCENNSSAIIENPKKNHLKPEFTKPAVVQNSLAFSSTEDFNGFVQTLQKKPYDKLDEFINKNFENFTSLKQKKKQIRGKNNTAKTSEILKLNIADPNFASIVNENGVFQIGEQVYKVTNQYTYIFKNRAAFESFSFSKAINSTSSPSLSNIAPCQNQRELMQLQNDVYRAENCGGPIGGGTVSDDNDKTHPNELDLYANLEKDYPSKRTEKYESGGTEGRLKGKSWNQNFYVYSSVGAKSVHERYTWLNWWNRSAEKITLDSFIRYSYGEKKVGYNTIKAGLTINYGSFLDSKVNTVLTDVLGMNSNSSITRFLVDQINNLEYQVDIYKHNLNEGYDITLYRNNEAVSKVKSDAKRIRKVFDWSTAIVNYPPGIKQSAVDFDLEMLRSMHTLKHDGFHYGFITDKRK